MSDSPIRIVQITDMHIFADTQKTLLGVPTNLSFQAVLSLLQNEAQLPDFILLTGDLSQDGSEHSYRYIADQLKTVNVPVYCVPGNHDYSKSMSQIYPHETVSMLKQIVLPHWQVILLDSQKPGCVEGYLADSELNFLETCLQAYPAHNAIVAFHHHPVLVGSAWLDNLGLTNAEALWDILKKYPTVKSVLSGHVHQEHETQVNGITYLATPSTSIQFKKYSDVFALEELPPGYRWLELYPNGTIQTALRRIATYIGKFAADAEGY